MPAINKLILQLIQTNTVQTHAGLSELLAEKGFVIPQATLSRRLKALSITKVNGAYQSPLPSYPHTTAQIITHILTSESGQIIIRTHPGHASSVAAMIDANIIATSSPQHNVNLLGSLSGDDTVLLIAKSQKATDSIIKSLKILFPQSPDSH